VIQGVMVWPPDINYRMRTELITIETDSIPIEGLFYKPEGKILGSALYFHGNTMNFYTGGAKFLASPLVNAGIAFFAFNRRGHDILSTRASRTPEGGAFQTITESFADNEYARNWLIQQGFDAPILIGHSNGGMLAVAHAARHPDTPALILLSAVRGGVGQDLKPASEKLFAMDQADRIIKEAKTLVSQGKGKELIQMPGWYYVISAESFLDRLESIPDTISLARQIRCPVLAIRGDLEDKDRYPAEEFQAACLGKVDVQIINHCDHFYNSKEDVVSNLIVNWLKNQFKK
jgi:pimeloyl-ACP methyl ester carboxylesterase